MILWLSMGRPPPPFQSSANLRVSGIIPYSEGIDFRRQNLTSVDIRFWRVKSIPTLKE